MFFFAGLRFCLDKISWCCDQVFTWIWFFLGLFYFNYTALLWHYLVYIVVSFLLLTGVIPVAPKEGDLRHHAAWAREFSRVTPIKWWLAHLRLLRLEQHAKPDLVIAQYREDLSWLPAYLPYVNKVFVYCKDVGACGRGLGSKQELAPQRLSITHLPNVGREAHSYLYHIIQHYHDHVGRLVFSLGSLQGNPMRLLSFVQMLGAGEHRSMTRHLKMSERVWMYEYTLEPPVLYLDNINHDIDVFTTYVPLSLGGGYLKSYTFSKALVPAFPRGCGLWAQYYFGLDFTKPIKVLAKGIHGAIFTVDAEQIRRFPVDTYKRVYVQNQNGDYLEAGYYLEVLWRLIWAQQ